MGYWYVVYKLYQRKERGGGWGKGRERVAERENERGKER